MATLTNIQRPPISRHIPILLMSVNVVGLLVMFIIEWVPKREVPYRWYTVTPMFIIGLLTTLYHHWNDSAFSLFASALGWNVITVLLLVVAIIWPSKECCAKSDGKCADTPCTDLRNRMKCQRDDQEDFS